MKYTNVKYLNPALLFHNATPTCKQALVRFSKNMKINAMTSRKRPNYHFILIPVIRKNKYIGMAYKTIWKKQRERKNNESAESFVDFNTE